MIDSVTKDRCDQVLLACSPLGYAPGSTLKYFEYIGEADFWG